LPRAISLPHRQIGLRVRIGAPLPKAFGDLPSAQARVHDQQARKAALHLMRQGQPEQSAPVLTHEQDAIQLQPLDESHQHRAVPVERVPRGIGRLVRATEANEVGGHHAHTGAGEHRDHVAVQVRPRRIAVQTQLGHRGLARALVDVVDAQAIQS
jgi:hypothetical protein